MLTGPVRALAAVQAVFLVLNTVANFSAPHPIERWVMGSVTLVLSALTLVIALTAAG